MIIYLTFKYENAYHAVVFHHSQWKLHLRNTPGIHFHSLFLCCVRYSEFGTEMHRSVHSEWFSWSHSATMHNCKVCYRIISKRIMAWCVVTGRWAPNSMEIMMTASNGNILFRCRSKKTSKLRVTGLCEGNSPGTGEFPAQMASNAENISIWWRHHIPGTKD